MSSKERSVRFSTKKPIEHESFEYAEHGNGDFERLMQLPNPPLLDDAKFDQFDLFTAASLGWEFVEPIASSTSRWGEKNTAGWTPMMYSAYLGHLKVCELLFSRGTPLDATNDLGQTALMLSASCGSKDMVDFLLKHGASVSRQDNKGQSALHYATKYNQSSITELLAKAGGDPNQVDYAGMTPMLNACKVGNDVTVSLLLKHNGDPNRVNKAGENGETLAADQPNVLKVLQSRLTMSDLLRQLGLEKYVPTFERDEITLNLFLKLTEEDLHDMGIKLFGPKKKLMNVIRYYEKNGVIATDQEVTADIGSETPEAYGPLVTPPSERSSTPRFTTPPARASNSSIAVTRMDLHDQLSVDSETRLFLTMLIEENQLNGHQIDIAQRLIHKIDMVMEKLKTAATNPQTHS